MSSDATYSTGLHDTCWRGYPTFTRTPFYSHEEPFFPSWLQFLFTRHTLEIHFVVNFLSELNKLMIPTLATEAMVRCATIFSQLVFVEEISRMLDKLTGNGVGSWHDRSQLILKAVSENSDLLGYSLNCPFGYTIRLTVAS